MNVEKRLEKFVTNFRQVFMKEVQDSKGILDNDPEMIMTRNIENLELVEDFR